MNKQAIVIHSGGMDSSICLALAIKEFGASNVLSLSFRYHQRHEEELVQAALICREWGVDHTILEISCLKEITENSLTHHHLAITHHDNAPPNTLVVGRNGLMARLGAIHAHHLGAHCIFMGVIEVESANSGYRDCTRAYMDKMEEILRIDLDDPKFEIRTPVVYCTKAETLAIAYQLGVLDYLLEKTITCYEGLSGVGCQICPACLLRKEGIRDYRRKR